MKFQGKIRIEGSFSASKRPKQDRWQQTEFGLCDVTSRAAICLLSHRSFFTMMYFNGSFEYRVSFPVKTRNSTATGSGHFAFLGRDFVQSFGQIVLIRVMTPINTNVVA